ncbi:hypothetical protein SAZ_40865 [Streptomyces noursei ZPM]|nr:hypothetical protein SAZ_40865 [Streptomyces noursei ZPM]
MPMMAIGSSSAGGPVGTATAPADRAPASSPCRKAASAAGLGWSKTIVDGSVRPVTDVSRLRRATAVSESKPMSRKARWSVRSSAEDSPRTAAASVRTVSRRVRCRSASDRACRAAANSPRAPASASRSAVAVSRWTSGTSSKSGVGRPEV